jgi:hypothetical protein
MKESGAACGNYQEPEATQTEGFYEIFLYYTSGNCVNY